MGDRRFFVEPKGDSIELDDDEAHHARRVLRLETGADIICFDGNGRSWLARIERYEPRRAVLEILEARPVEPEPCPRLRLAIGLLKNEAMDLVIQKATELGASTVLPVLAEFSEVRGEWRKRLVRWRRIAIASAKQCERNRVPEIAPPMTLREALVALDTPAIALVERGAGSLRDAIDSVRSSGVSALTAFVGPEGGWSEPEKAELRAAGVACATLGTRILRAETSAIAALAILGYAFDDPTSEIVVTEGIPTE